MKKIDKKKKIIFLAIIIVVIVGIIIISLIISNNNQNTKQDNLRKIYDKLMASQEYSFKMEKNDNNKTIMAKNGEQTVIDQYSEDEGHLTTLIKDRNTYLIYHDREEYYLYENNNPEQNMLTDGFKEIIDRDYAIGTEKINNKNYYYEEYTGTTIFMSINALNINSEDVKTRFYFDKDDNLVYMKTTYGDNEELLNIELLDTTDNSIFEIPSNYAEN